MKRFSLMLLAFAFLLVINSCSKTELGPEESNIPDDVLTQIARLGFSTEKVIKDEDGYIVEGDIVLRTEDLLSTPNSIRVPQAEQYHTFNLVTGLPRTIKVFLKTSGANKLPTSYIAGLDEAIARYNAENLQLTFQRVTSSSGANIQIVRGTGSYLASAGFPTSSGNPYSQVKVNSSYLGSNPNTNYLATILAHEMGHCIGFRHTDWFDRSISCGGATSYEGQETTGVGAVHIPGTPEQPNFDPGSFMLSCIGTNQNRPFTSADVTALTYLY